MASDSKSFGVVRGAIELRKCAFKWWVSVRLPHTHQLTDEHPEPDEERQGAESDLQFRAIDSAGNPRADERTHQSDRHNGTDRGPRQRLFPQITQQSAGAVDRDDQQGSGRCRSKGKPRQRHHCGHDDEAAARPREASQHSNP